VKAVSAIHAGSAAGDLDELGTDQVIKQILGPGEWLIDAQPA
jgi:hypothetical protein